MAKLSMKLAQDRHVLGLRAKKTQHKIEIARRKDAIKKIDVDLQQMRPKRKPDPTTV